MIRNRFNVLTSVLFCCCVFACKQNADINSFPDYTFPYQMDFPAKTILLPEQLKEISGIAIMSSGEFACVQDEDGFILVYDTLLQEVNRVVTFGSKSDYEDISIVGDHAYVLESDGTIRAIFNFDQERYRREKYSFPFSGNYNTEGICYDEPNNRLLIASKNAGNIENAKSGKRQIFALSLTDSSYQPTPAFAIDFDDVRDYFLHANDTLGQKAVEKSGPMMIFKPSAIQKHPISGHLYLLSAYPQMIAVIHHESGQLLYASMLPPDILPQPEGIAFDKKGTLWIASEGKSREGRITGYHLKP